MMQYDQMGRARRIALVACCKNKLGKPAPASELYTSTLFRKASAYAKTFGSWYILSAKHGLVHPCDVIEPYDYTLTRAKPIERAIWGRRVLAQMAEAGIVQSQFVALAGAKYTTPLLEAGLALEMPLNGMGIGKRLAWLGAQLGAD
jgi:hypothetical protein